MQSGPNSQVQSAKASTEQFCAFLWGAGGRHRRGRGRPQGECCHLSIYREGMPQFSSASYSLSDHASASRTFIWVPLYCLHLLLRHTTDGKVVKDEILGRFGMEMTVLSWFGGRDQAFALGLAVPPLGGGVDCSKWKFGQSLPLIA